MAFTMHDAQFLILMGTSIVVSAVAGATVRARPAQIVIAISGIFMLGHLPTLPTNFIAAQSRGGDWRPAPQDDRYRVSVLPNVRGDKKASVSWKPPADDGGFAVTGYTATAQPGGATCATGGDGRDCEITGLTNGSNYTVHVTATNAVGTSTDALASVTPATTPSAPTAVTATPGFRTASVSWQAPASTGGDQILGCTVVANPGGRTCTAAGGQCVVTGLNDFGTYTFTVTARNSVGNGPPSDPSDAITLSGDEVVAHLAAGSQVNTGDLTPMIRHSLRIRCLLVVGIPT